MLHTLQGAMPHTVPRDRLTLTGNLVQRIRHTGVAHYYAPPVSAQAQRMPAPLQ